MLTERGGVEPIMTAGHITGVSSMATRQILADLVGPYEQRTGCTVAIKAMGGVDAAKAVRAGAATDIVILASNVMRQLEAEGHIIAGSRMDFARSGMAMAVRGGAMHPPIQNGDAVKLAILQAKTIAFSTGPSGDHLKRLWQQWGIAETMASRAIQASAGVPVGDLVARGEADLGFQQLSELLHCPGIEIVGPLPPDIQSITVFSAGVGHLSSNRDIARAFVAYLNSSDTDVVKRQHGMEASR